jgi:hypothetical protein
MMFKPSATINIPPVSNYLEGEARQRALRESLGVLGRDGASLALAAADRSGIQVINPVKIPSSLDCVPSGSAGAWEWDDEGAGGAGGGAAVHVQRAERGEHTVGYAMIRWEPGAGMMREMEGRSEALAGTSSAQEGANTSLDGSC